jgi:thiamine kinase-like enzyme
MAQPYGDAETRLQEILERLEPALGGLEGVPTPLAGGITNRNFRVRMDGEEYVVRVHGRDTDLLGIDRVAERLASEAAAQLKIGPDVATAHEDCLVTRFIACTPAEPAQIIERVEEAGRALRAFHDCAVGLPRPFWVPDLLARYAAIVHQRGGSLPSDYRVALDVAAQIGAALPVGTGKPCHNDLLAGNLILPEDGGPLLIVDWEYSGVGHPCFDLGNLSVNNDFDEDADERLLCAYDGGAPAPERRAALKLMRVLSDARESAWGVVQGVVSELDFDFDAYAREHFERLRAAVAGPAYRRWLAEAEWNGSEVGRAHTA